MSRTPKIRVLVVDDEEEFAEALVLLLDRRGFDASAVTSGEKALAALQVASFDVVVLDLRMPGMDGLAALREIRRAAPSVSVLMLTGHGCASTGIAVMQLGAVDFLQKPVEIQRLASVIDAAFESSSRGGEGVGEAAKQRARDVSPGANGPPERSDPDEKEGDHA